MERKIIAHRANLTGPNRETENTFESITTAINTGFDVEVDVWRIFGELCLGHDFDKTRYYKNTEIFLLDYAQHLWIHCKNIEALIYLKIFNDLNVFGHDNDNYVLTSKGNVFCKPGYTVNKSVVIVMPEMTPIYKAEDFSNCYGVCTDYPLNVRRGDYSLFTS